MTARKSRIRIRKISFPHLQLFISFHTQVGFFGSISIALFKVAVFRKEVIEKQKFF